MPSKEQFLAYERVRKGGKYNMFDPRARLAAKLSREIYLAVIENYAALCREYLPSRYEEIRK